MDRAAKTALEAPELGLTLWPTADGKDSPRIGRAAVRFGPHGPRGGRCFFDLTLSVEIWPRSSPKMRARIVTSVSRAGVTGSPLKRPDEITARKADSHDSLRLILQLP